MIANGKTYDANYDNYFAFLNQFRTSIEKIAYDLGSLIVEGKKAAIPMKAYITRVDKSKEIFEAILILEWDQDDKIVLWHEVYLKIENC